MKEINFRGKENITGKILYGDLIHIDGHPFIKTGPVLSARADDYHGVLESSVAQFVGYDRNGKEVYSDDKIRVKDFSKYCMDGTGIEIAGDIVVANDFGKTFDNIELVKEK